MLYKLRASILQEGHLILGVLLLIALRPVEINFFILDRIIDPILWFGIPILIAIIFSDFNHILFTIMKIVVVIVFIGATLVASLRYAICGIDKRDYLTYIHKENSRLTISRKCFTCLMTDCDYVYLKKRKLLPYVYWTSNIDIKQMDKSEWDKVE